MKRLVIFLLLFIVPFTACVGGESGEEQYFAVRTDYSSGYVTIYNDSNFDWRGVTITINEDYSYTFGSVNEGDDRRINIGLFENEYGSSFDYTKKDPYLYTIKIDSPKIEEDIHSTFGNMSVEGYKYDSLDELNITNTGNYIWNNVKIDINKSSIYKSYSYEYPSTVCPGETIKIKYRLFYSDEWGYGTNMNPKYIEITASDSAGGLHTWSGSWD